MDCKNEALYHLILCLSGDDSNSDKEDESMSEGEMAKLMEEVEEKKKLIANIRSKPWRMKRRLKVLKYWGALWFFFL